jgi:hypothetical protein
VTVTAVDHAQGTIALSFAGTATTVELDDAAGAFVRSASLAV